MTCSDKSIRLSVAVSYFLHQKFPHDAIVVGPAGDEHFRPDIALVDYQCQRYLAFVEHGTDESRLTPLAQEYSDYLRRANLSVPVYFFAPAENETDDIKIYALAGKRDWAKISKEEFPTYAALTAIKSANEKIVIGHDRDEAVDEFKREAQALGCFLLFLFVLCWALGTELSKTQLTLLGGAVILFLLPNYKRISAAGVEFERLSEPCATKAKPEDTKD